MPFYLYTAIIFVGVLAALLVYLIPSFVAFHREHENKAGVLLVNFFAGWTIVGWIWCLIWAKRD
ncbi:superinfection immunity protein [Agrobacterium salinitolerans]|nr:superinfection immunity protein [Agrobacterium salinitolerans]